MNNNILQNQIESLLSLSSNFSEKIEVTTYNININKLDKKLNGLTIAQISDLHINKWNLELIEHTIDVLNKINPDIVAITGDIICNGSKFIPDLIRLFKKINCRYGIYSCIGNHDHSDGGNSLKIQAAYKKCNVQALVNDSTMVNINGAELYIAGADDLQLGEQNISQMIKNISDTSKAIFLTHNPINFKEFAKYNPELVLAGHTHGGQLNSKIFGLFYKILANTQYVSGLYSMNKSLLYVNRGIGTALLGPKFFNKKILIRTPRINSKPEISLFKLIS